MKRMSDTQKAFSFGFVLGILFGAVLMAIPLIL